MTTGCFGWVRVRQVSPKECRDLGVPVATHKTEGPTTQLTFLGGHRGNAAQLGTREAVADPSISSVLAQPPVSHQTGAAVSDRPCEGQNSIKC